MRRLRHCAHAPLLLPFVICSASLSSLSMRAIAAVACNCSSMPSLAVVVVARRSSVRRLSLCSRIVATSTHHRCFSSRVIVLVARRRSTRRLRRCADASPLLSFVVVAVIAQARLPWPPLPDAARRCRYRCSSPISSFFIAVAIVTRQRLCRCRSLRARTCNRSRPSMPSLVVRHVHRALLRSRIVAAGTRRRCSSVMLPVNVAGSRVCSVCRRHRC